MKRVTPLLLAIAGSAVVVAGRHDVRGDWTFDGRNTLADLSEQVVRGLDRDVEAIAFVTDEASGRARVGDLLERYARCSSRFTYRITGRSRDPLLAEQLGVAADGTLVLRAGARREAVRILDEPGITNALVRLERTGGRRVRFLAGHRERGIRDTSPGGLSRLAGDLAATGVAAQDLLLLTGQELPGPASLVVVAGPRADLFPAEIAWLERHLAAGGRLLALVDPGPPGRLGAFLAGLGVEIGEDVIVDPQTRLYGADATVPVVTRYARHPVTDPLAGSALVPTFFPVARSVRPAPGPLRVEVLASTGEHAWAERDRDSLESGATPRPDGNELRGPVPIAVTAVRPENDAPVLIVVGDSDFATNGNLDLAGNRDLAVNAIEWLLRDDDRIALRAARANVRPLVLDEREFRRAVWLPAFGLPVLTAVVGMVMRRRTLR